MGSSEPWSVVVVSQNDDCVHRLRHRVQGAAVMANGYGDRFFRCVRRDQLFAPPPVTLRSSSSGRRPAGHDGGAVNAMRRSATSKSSCASSFAIGRKNYYFLCYVGGCHTAVIYSLIESQAQQPLYAALPRRHDRPHADLPASASQNSCPRRSSNDCFPPNSAPPGGRQRDLARRK
jgi:hypothetical protein